VRIVQYGDSHTAADFGTGAFRRTLQARFGDGGRGFVSLGQPWKGYRQEGIDGGMSREFAPVRVTYHHGTIVGAGGAYGLLGIGIGTEKAAARAWTSVRSPTTRIELATWMQPRGGSFDVFIDGVRQDRVSTRGDPGGSRFLTFDVTDGPHDVEVRTLGDGDVRVFGMSLDRTETGVVVDALGINGAQIGTPLHWGEEHFAEQLRHRAPALVVLAYGTNESLEATLDDEEFERRLVEVLGRVARAVPAASCLILGPPDRGQRVGTEDGGRSKADGLWESAPRISEIADLERRVADAAGCAFYDEIAAMGGAGTIVQWATEVEPRAASDRVHLTRSGYVELGRAFAQDVLDAYEAWRQREGLGPPKHLEAAGVGSLGSGLRP
jgi:lysophospholipase L1-like esterase